MPSLRLQMPGLVLEKEGKDDWPRQNSDVAFHISMLLQSRLWPPLSDMSLAPAIMNQAVLSHCQRDISCCKHGKMETMPGSKCFSRGERVVPASNAPSF